MVEGTKFQNWAGLTPIFKYRLFKNWLGPIREHPTYEMAFSAFRRIQHLGARNASCLFVAKLATPNFGRG
jgi:hypothetical protein